MPKGKVTETGGRSNKIRFLYVDADLSDGNLSDVMTALTGAFRPAQTVRTIERIPLKPAGGPTNGTRQELLLDQTVDDAEEPEQDVDSTQDAQPPKPRKLPLPNYLHDLDTSGGGTSLKDFIDEHQTNKHLRRYLVASYWLDRHGKHESVNADKMYTVYRTVGWQPSINDWDSNFRSLVKANKLRRVSPGEYTITPIGEAEVQEGDADKT